MSAPIQADDSADHLSVGVFQSMLCEQLWKNFGFRRRPRRGMFWDRFVPAERLAVERFLSREFAVIALANTVKAVSRAGLDDPGAFLARVLLQLVAKEGIRMAMNFDSAQDAMDFYCEGAREYLEVPDSRWGGLLLRRAPTSQDKKLSARLLVGAAFLLLPDRSIFPHILTAASNTLSNGIVGKVSLPDDLADDLAVIAEELLEMCLLQENGLPGL